MPDLTFSVQFIYIYIYIYIFFRGLKISFILHKKTHPNLGDLNRVSHTHTCTGEVPSGTMGPVVTCFDFECATLTARIEGQQINKEQGIIHTTNNE